ncbi:MAG: type III-B CRISPR module RAMP protein Cmr4 [Pyrobaculum sp.]
MEGKLLVGSPPVYTTASLLVVEAVTNLHVGVGRSGATVDLPIQRDEHGFPTIYASSLKGALKTATLWAYLKTGKDLDKARRVANILFGPDPEPEEAFESSVAILDAVLAAIPARSLKGVYAYVTSPYLVGRVLDYMRLTSSQPLPDLTQKLSKLGGDGCVCIGNCDEVKVKEVEGKVVLMEEFWLNCEGGVTFSEEEKKLLTLGGRLEKPLLVLGDDVAREVVNRALIKMARVRISRSTKTVEKGGLWSEEYVPARTRFVTAALFKRPPVSKLLVVGIKGEGQDKGERQELDDAMYLKALKELGFIADVKEVADLAKVAEGIAQGVKNKFLELLQKLNYYIIVGGHETIGKGIVRITQLDYVS